MTSTIRLSGAVLYVNQSVSWRVNQIEVSTPVG